MSGADIPDEYNVDHYPSERERHADWWVHLIGLSGGWTGAIVLAGVTLFSSRTGEGAAVAVYALSLVFLLSCSAVYNLSAISPMRPFLRRLDEAAIFVLIAGSYTPFTTLRLTGVWAFGMTAAVWTLALAGAAGKLLAPAVSERVWTMLYIALGWIALVAIGPFTQSVRPVALGLLLCGGLLYTIGAALFLRPSLPFRRAIWHGFVAAGAGCHYAAVILGVIWARPV